MGRPIRVRPSSSGTLASSARAALDVDLENSADALRQLLELVRMLDERGFLRFSADLLREEDRVVEVVSTRFRPEDLRRSVANLEVLVRTFRDIDPETLGALAKGVPAALKESRRSESDRPMGLFEIASALRDPDVNRGVRMVLGFLRGIGTTAGK
jgi:uncharacterized protein YjgD (DUF1641 family)